jgi:hypothetical protein
VFLSLFSNNILYPRTDDIVFSTYSQLIVGVSSEIIMLAVVVDSWAVARAYSFFYIFALSEFQITMSASQEEHIILVSILLHSWDSSKLDPNILVMLSEWMITGGLESRSWLLSSMSFWSIRSTPSCSWWVRKAEWDHSDCHCCSCRCCWKGRSNWRRVW